MGGTKNQGCLCVPLILEMGMLGISKILLLIFSRPDGLGLLFLSLPSQFPRTSQGCSSLSSVLLQRPGHKQWC